MALQDDPYLAALDEAPDDDETPGTDEEEAVRAASAEPIEDWFEVSRGLSAAPTAPHEGT